MKIVTSILFLTFSYSQAFGCSAPPSDSGCRMNIEIAPIQEIISGEESVRGFRVNGSVSGYGLGRGGNQFSVIDDDGAVTLTAIYNVLATENVLQRNQSSEVVLDNNSIRLMREAVNLGFAYMDALPEDQRSPDRREAYENLRTALASVGPSNRIPAGFLNDKLGAILRRTNQTRDQDIEGQEFASYRTVISGDGGETLGQAQQLCVNPRSGLRCGPGFIVTGLGANFCTRKFDTGEVYPTSNCPEGVQYQFGSVGSGGSRTSTSSSVSGE